MSVSAFKMLQSKVDRIFFGGEGTDEVFNGYVQGGLDSGERTANEILKCISGACSAEYDPSTDNQRMCKAFVKKSSIGKYD